MKITARDIRYAISDIEDYVDDLQGEGDIDEQVLDIAVAAMKELEAREKGCGLCAKLFTGGTHARMLDPDAKFCKRCGKKLGVRL